MFSLEYTSPCEIQGDIEVDDRRKVIPGPLVDQSGVRWDIRGVFMSQGEYFVLAARRSKTHPYYYDTTLTSYGIVSQTWKPYRLVEAHRSPESAGPREAQAEWDRT